MRLRVGSIKEFSKALNEAQPWWAKVYTSLVGLPAWIYLAYRGFTSGLVPLRTLDRAAIVVVISSSVVQMAVLFRAFRRNKI
jgi:hypothetical protein